MHADAHVVAFHNNLTIRHFPVHTMQWKSFANENQKMTEKDPIRHDGATAVITEKKLEEETLSTEESKGAHSATLVVLMAIGVVLLVVLVIVLLQGAFTFRRARKQKKASRSSSSGRRPEKMKSGKINSENFKHVGVLVLDRKLEGPVRHMLENTVDGSIKRVQFDERLNEIVDIGSDIEQMNVSQNTARTTPNTLDLMSEKRKRENTREAVSKLGKNLDSLKTAAAARDTLRQTQASGVKSQFVMNG